MRGLVLVVVVGLVGCASGSYSSVGSNRYARTRAEDVRVLDVEPHDAELIGTVDGVERAMFGSGLEDARTQASKLGADAIWVTGRGATAGPGGIGGGSDTVHANAYRLRR